MSITFYAALDKTRSAFRVHRAGCPDLAAERRAVRAGRVTYIFESSAATGAEALAEALAEDFDPARTMVQAGFVGATQPCCDEPPKQPPATPNGGRNFDWRTADIAARAAGFKRDAGPGYRAALIAFAAKHDIPVPAGTRNGPARKAAKEA